MCNSITYTTNCTVDPTYITVGKKKDSAAFKSNQV